MLLPALFTEMNRVRELIKQYEDPQLKGSGLVAAFHMKIDIERTEKAISADNVIEMLVQYERLKNYTS